MKLQRPSDMLELITLDGFSDADLVTGDDERAVVEHGSGDLFKVTRGEIWDAAHTPIAAFTINPSGEVIALERTPGPQTRAELEERRSRPRPASRRRRARA
jgi:hypothetical protein